MNVFISIVKIRIQLLLQYRMAAVAGIFTQIFFGFFMIMIYEAFYQTGSGERPMTYNQLVTYVWLGQAFLALLPWNGDREIQSMIKSGQVAYEFLRPLNLYNYWYARMFAKRLANATLRCFPLLVFASLLPSPYNILPPSNLGHFLMFSTIMIGAVILGVAMTNIITISVLFTIGDGVDRIFPAVVTFFSGLVIPIPLFPEWAQWIFRILPFSGLSDAPYRFYLGLYDLDQFIWSIGHIFLWTLVTVLFGHYMIYKAHQRVVIQGG